MKPKATPSKGKGIIATTIAEITEASKPPTIVAAMAYTRPDLLRPRSFEANHKGKLDSIMENKTKPSKTIGAKSSGNNYQHLFMNIIDTK